MPTLTNDEILGAIDQMPVKQLADLVKAVQDRYGVTASAPVAVAVAGGAAGVGAAAAAEEKTTFAVVLTGAGDKKIQVIKVVREVTGLGLKEAKDLVDGAPKPIKEGVSKEEAEGIRAKFADSGATIDIK